MEEDSIVYPEYFDEAWKKIIEKFFPQLISLFVPEMYVDIDLSKGISFLDKEMERLSKRSQKGAKYVDKLAKVYLKNGEEKWILIHIEVQSYLDKEFSKRMFRYFYRIFDRHDKEIVSMALLTNSKDDSPKGRYELLTYSSGVVFEYLSFGLMSYSQSELEKSDNPIAMVVLTSQEKEMAKRKG